MVIRADAEGLGEMFAPRVEGDRLTLSVGDKVLKTFLPTVVRRAYQDSQRRAATEDLESLQIQHR